MSIDNMQFGLIPGKGTTDAFSSCDKYKRNTKQRRRRCTMLLWIYKRRNLIEYGYGIVYRG